MFSSKNSISQRRTHINSCMKAQNSRQKYIVIDSQADQTYYCYNTQPHLYTNNYISADRCRNDSVYVEQHQRAIERSIMNAQSQVLKIQSQCELLQKIINDMIKEQASLIVQQRRQQRSQSIRQYQNTHYKASSTKIKRFSSTIKNINNSIDKFQKPNKDQSIQKFTYTPLLSENIQNYPQQLQPEKTKQITSYKRNVENITPKKKYNGCCPTKHESCPSDKKKRCIKHTKF